MQPGRLDLTIYAGSTRNIQVQWKGGDPAIPVDITNYTARMQIRKRAGDATVIDELTTANSRIAITNAAQGILEVRFPASVTALYDFCVAVYDLELVAPDTTTVYRILEGSVSLSPEVTK